MIVLTNKAKEDLEILIQSGLDADSGLAFSILIESLELLERCPGLGASGSIPDTRELKLSGGILAVYTRIDDSILLFRILPDAHLESNVSNT